MNSNKDIESRFSELVENNKNRINQICSVYAKSEEDRKDLVQDVLMNIWKSLPSFEHRANINTWLYRITLNVCLRSKYEKVRRTNVQLENIRFEPISDVPKNEKYEHLYHCINQLNDTDKAVTILFLEDLSYKEIAEIVGISENYVAVKIKRIKAQLFKCLNTLNS